MDFTSSIMCEGGNAEQYNMTVMEALKWDTGPYSRKVKWQKDGRVFTSSLSCWIRFLLSVR